MHAKISSLLLVVAAATINKSMAVECGIGRRIYWCVACCGHRCCPTATTTTTTTTTTMSTTTTTTMTTTTMTTTTTPTTMTTAPSGRLMAEPTKWASFIEALHQFLNVLDRLKNWLCGSVFCILLFGAAAMYAHMYMVEHRIITMYDHVGSYKTF